MLSRTQQGLTLIELIIAMAVTGTMLTLAIPAVANWSDNNRMKATADALLSGLQLAKMEAVRRNTRAQFALTDAPAAGGQSGNWEICIADSLGGFVIQGSSWWATEVGTATRIGVSTSTLTGQNFATPLAAGAALTGYLDGCVGSSVASTNVNVTFDPLGRIAANTITPSITRIDILNARPDNAKRRLVIRINPQGQIKLCNPASGDANQRC